MVLLTVPEVKLLSQSKPRCFSNLLQSRDTSPKEDSHQKSNVGALSQLWKGFFLFTDYRRSRREQCFDFGTSGSCNLDTSDIFGFKCLGRFSSREFTLRSVNLYIQQLCDAQLQLGLNHDNPLNSLYNQWTKRAISGEWFSQFYNLIFS